MCNLDPSASPPLNFHPGEQEQKPNETLNAMKVLKHDIMHCVIQILQAEKIRVKDTKDPVSHSQTDLS